MGRSRKINLEKVRASLDKICPKCGFTITPDLVKRVDFERIERWAEEIFIRLIVRPVPAWTEPV